ncbi:hypothetical protein ACIGEZ_31105 [Streptomyces sp. NPDC085481]|uniref:hypothetical protein n=1 Tax=Streptomyces sp. NPDC085481 TaxID=3365727 RepID=UPI0037D7DA45
MESAQNAPAPAPDPAPVPGPVPVPEGAPKRRRTGRTVALIAVAAVLGIVGGTAVGYGVQAEREPTPLPALNQPGLAYPAKPLPKGQEPTPLSVAADRGLKTDGDLRKLLLPKPAGARTAERWQGDGWVDVADYLDGYVDEKWMFESTNELGIRRTAATSWDSGQSRTVKIELVQFRSGDQLGAAEHAEGQRDYMPDAKEGAGNEGDLLKGTAEGRYYLYPVERKAGYLDFYAARAVFHRGDVMVDIHIFDSKKISKSDIRALAEKQLERL